MKIAVSGKLARTHPRTQRHLNARTDKLLLGVMDTHIAAKCLILSACTLSYPTLSYVHYLILR